MIKALSLLLIPGQRSSAQIRQIPGHTLLQQMRPMQDLTTIDSESSRLETKKPMRVIPKNFPQEPSSSTNQNHKKQEFLPMKKLFFALKEIPPAPPPPEVKSVSHLESLEQGKSVFIEKQSSSKISNFSVSPVLAQIPSPPKEEKKIVFFHKPTNQLPVMPISMLAKSSKRYVAVDLESTGLGKNQAITEIGCVEIKNWRVTGMTFQTYVNPECNVGPVAYKMTGLSWSFLSQYPTFQQVAPHLSKFIGRSIPIFHDASNDSKWLKESLKHYGYSAEYLRFDNFKDTFQMAQKINLHDKKGLRSLCELYGIDTKNQETHGALIDAKLLAELFCKMVRKDDNIIDDGGENIDIENFDDIVGTPGEEFLRNMGVKGSLGKIRFSSDLYHPESKQNYPAILIPFIKESICKGIYVRYLLNSQQLTLNKKIFYGEPEMANFDVHSSEQSKTTFICNLINALLVRDVLLDENSQDLLNSLGIQNGFNVRACIDLEYLSNSIIDSDTKEFIVVVDPQTNLSDIKTCLLKFFRYLQLIKTHLKILTFRSDQDNKTTMTELINQQPQYFKKQFANIIEITDEKNLDCLSRRTKEFNTIKQAQEIYESAKPIYKNTSAFKYFQKRGLHHFLPTSFRWSELYYPWLQRKLPAVIAPMYDENQNFTAVHQVFCYEDGSPIPKRLTGLNTGRRRNKITWGKASGSAVQFTNSGESALPNDLYNVIFIGEGLENTMVVAQVISILKTSHPRLTQELYKKFGITDKFLFQACLGVNDVKQAPLSKGKKNIIMLADNDGKDNLEVNKTVKDNARSFLASQHDVFIALPFLPEGKEKLDFNDVYLQASQEFKRCEAVASILLEAVKINRIEDLGDDNEPLEDSLKRILITQRNAETSKSKKLDEHLKQLLDDPFFDKHHNS